MSADVSVDFKPAQLPDADLAFLLRLIFSEPAPSERAA